MTTADTSPGHLAFWARPDDERAAVFAALRRHDGLPWIPFRDPTPFSGGVDGFHAVVRHADVVTASRNAGLFANAPNAASLFDIPPWLTRYLDSMIQKDGPEHARLRKVVVRAFSPRMLARLEDDIRARASRIVDDVLAQRSGEFVSGVAQRLPVAVICAMLGLDDSHHDLVARHGNTLVGSADPEYTGVRRSYLMHHGAPGVRHVVSVSARLAFAGEALHRLVRRTGRDRLREPRDDLVSTLVHADVDGERLTPREVATLFILLVLAGSETTRATITHALRLLTAHPEQREHLLADVEGRIGATVEEVVRHASPVLQFRRTATADGELGGTEVRAGDKLLLFYTSANRDEAVFDDPDRFDISRSPGPHLGFGAPGPHYCLGANLARTESTILLTELLTRAPTIRAVGEPDRLLSNFVNGIKRQNYTL
ncbi:cytochrome P450 [Pseudonocardia broussonetiae]|uniref:Cytochrome P450 n=1 Tax=Pseudonocardia broussonetiae TaxID=2736640 RepID=A0A6M6JQG6_9PSEU|nr:cytochrome P450 [Pseudonocardia broussonetiae]QJY48659.1 cytochrome P450 [Pseudonocardia broussonetiae]